MRNSTPRRHCEASEKSSGEVNDCCRSKLLIRAMSKLRDCFVAMALVKKTTLTKLLAMTIKKRLLRRHGHQLKNEH